MDTAPLPAIPAEDPPPHGGESAAARALVGAAGVVSGGLVVIGLGLVVLQLIKGDIAPGTGSAAAAGPTWRRALAQLAVGAAGECMVWLRPRVGPAARVWLSVAVLVVAGLVLWLCWWR